MKNLLFYLLIALAPVIYCQVVEVTEVLPSTSSDKLYSQGNYKEALNAAEDALFKQKLDGKQAVQNLNVAVNCLNRLGRQRDFDSLIEKVVVKYDKSWRVLKDAAQKYLGATHYGYMIGNQFERGWNRRSGRSINCYDRDRTRAIQLYVKAMPLVVAHGSAYDKRYFFSSFAGVFQSDWQMLHLTDYSKLPEYSSTHSNYNRWNASGAPVDAEGNPVYYHIPSSWEKAKNDGERWRWLLDQSQKYGNSYAEMTFASFLWNQFGVQKMASYGYGKQFSMQKEGPYSVHLLSDDETITRLATGIKRFKLPVEFNYIRIYQEQAKTKANGESALNQLATIFTNRRQYNRAAECLRESIKRFPNNSKYREQRLEQIVGNIGVFEPRKNPFPAGQKPKLILKYRNASSVTLSLRRLKLELFLKDLDEYLKSDPEKLDWGRLNFNNLGNLVVRNDMKKYLGESISEWVEKLQPAPKHFDREKELTIPESKPGLYLVTAQFKDGNIARETVWIADTAIVARSGATNVYYVADAATGVPINDAEIRFIGYRQEYLPRKKQKFNRRYKLHYDSFFGGRTGGTGLLELPPDKFKRYYSYMAIARTASGRLALLPYSNWNNYRRYYNSGYSSRKVYSITDRPVYRPGQKMHFKFWVRDVAYDNESQGKYASRTFSVRIYSGRGKEVFKQSLKADQWGGLEGDYIIPEDADLGRWRIYLYGYGGNGYFRVEEYKKPEFEVSVLGPDKTVKLGETFTAKVKANYYFGAPVTNAKVKYTVKRSKQEFKWYPPTPWDWLYGPGYWWCFPVYDWLPEVTYRCSIHLWWAPFYQPPPELVCENEVPIGPDGTAEIKIDTSFAKAMFGDSDHRYEITAEVTDSSRRTIVGSKNISVAAVPFRVAAWPNRGYYQAGDKVIVRFRAMNADYKGVPVTGGAKLYQLSYNKKGVPVEKELKDWKVAAAADGTGKVSFTAPASGQYRVLFKLRDADKFTVTGDTVFNVYGGKLKADDFRFNPLELILDKKTYAPGDKVKLRINTALNNSTVMIFLRPSMQAYTAPVVKRLDGKSFNYEFEVEKGDMPNCFIEVWTIAEGQLYKELRSICVPPEKRILNVSVKPSKTKYQPGGDAKVKVKLTGLDGKPVTGTVVMTVYDKSVEYISGGSNVPDIKDFFWKWKRNYYSNSISLLGIQFYNILKRGELRMSQLGVFGYLQAVDNDSNATFGAGGDARGRVMPAMAAPRALSKMKSDGFAKQESKADLMEAPAATEELDAVHVRKQFADTAFWAGVLTPDKNGEVEISLKMPENLTTWKIKAWCMSTGTRVGQGEAEVITSKDFLVRLEMPRFLVESDEAVISGIIHNYLSTPQSVTARLSFGGNSLSLADKPIKQAVIKPQGVARFDWNIKAVKEGEATLTLAATAPGGNDAMQLKCPVKVHGIMKQVAWCGTILDKSPNGNKAFITVELPEKRREEESKLQVNVSPSPALAIVDALPYLIGVDYRSTDTTLNRFLPSIVTAATLKKLDITLPQIQDKTTNLNPTETGNPVDRAKQWKRWDESPVFNPKELDRLVRRGLHTLKVMQLSDGGWGWFSGYHEHSTPYMTAYVMRGLMVARANGADVDSAEVNRGRQWLENHFSERLKKIMAQEEKKQTPYISNTDALVYLALMRSGSMSISVPPMLERLYKYRDQLSPYGKSLLALGLDMKKEPQKLDMLMRNLKQFLKIDNETQAAYLDIPSRWYWWFWYGSEIETQAAYLKLLSKTGRDKKVAAMLARYLIDNRKHASYWNSSRDTAFCVEALSEYLKVSGEAKPEMTVEIRWNGQVKKEVRITPENLFTFDNRLLMYGKTLTSGRHVLQITKKGSGNLYFNAYLSYFTLENFIKKSGLQVKVARKYYLLKRRVDKVLAEGSRGQAVMIGTAAYDRVELPDNPKVKSGDMVEVELIVESANDYEYLRLVDLKPAGCEAADLRSGYSGNSLGAYVEYRDDRVCMYVRRLPRGKYSVSYRLRAEIPGRFSALPAKVEALYAPELKGNSNEFKMNITDK